MKKWLLWLLVMPLLTGCSGEDPVQEEALAFRDQMAQARRICFSAVLSADYEDRVERFSLVCETDGTGTMNFTVAQPAEIAGITGSVTGETGTLRFEDTVLAFPMLAGDRLSPVSGPWVLIHTLRAGCLSAWAREGELLHLTMDDSYEEDPLTLEIWIRDGAVTGAEIAWRGIRQMTMEVENFRME